MRINQLGQPIGDALPDFQPGDLPNLERIEGQYVIIERLSKDKHRADLYEVYGPDSPADMWTYLFQNPVQSQEEWSQKLDQMLAAQDRFHYAIVDKESGKALGTFALMRIDRNNRVIEVGAVTYSPKLKRTDWLRKLSTCWHAMSLKSWSIAATNGNAMPSISRQGGRQRGLVSPTKAGFVRLLSIKGAIETLTGCL